MAIYLITGVVLVALIASMWRDNRSLWNPALLIIAVFFGYLSVVQAVYQSGSEAGHLLVLMVGFLGVPFLIFLSGFFFIYNGIVLLKREGKSKSNFLSLGMGFLILLFFGVIIIRALNNQYFYENHWVNIFLIFFRSLSYHFKHKNTPSSIVLTVLDGASYKQYLISDQSP